MDRLPLDRHNLGRSLRRWRIRVDREGLNLCARPLRAERLIKEISEDVQPKRVRRLREKYFHTRFEARRTGFGMKRKECAKVQFVAIKTPYSLSV